MSNQTRKRPTSFDVAERAGVSQSTVSRALAGADVITDATRQKVFKAAEELGYFVDERAARLRRGATGTLAVVVISRPGETVAQINPFYYILLGSVCEAASQRGFETLVSFQSEKDNFYGHYEERGWSDGLVVIGTGTNRDAWNYFRGLEEEGRRVAYWGSPFDELDWVRSDNGAGGTIAAERLIKAGVENPAFIGGGDGSPRQFRERLSAFSERYSAAGKTVANFDADGHRTRLEQGRAATAALLDSGTPCDGIFAACDAIALGVLEELRSREIIVPGDMQLIGFDNVPSSALCVPPLTTIGLDPSEAGELLVESALSQEPMEMRRVAVSLVERESVVPAAGVEPAA